MGPLLTWSPEAPHNGTVDDEEILACVAEALGLLPVGGSIEPLGGKQGLFVCRVTLPGSQPLIFKAVRESCRLELRLSAWLSQAIPYAAPAVLYAADDDQRGYYWLVMHDEGPSRLSDDPTISAYAAAASLLGSMQVDSLSRLADLREIGVPEMDAARWEETSLSLLAALDSDELGRIPDRGSLERSLWRVGEMASDAGMLPMALIHGDLHAGNIAANAKGEIRILDWGSAYIGSAFLGLSELLWPAARYARRLGDLGPVRKAYTDQWIPVVGKPGRLGAAVSACDALSRLSLLQESVRRPDRFGDFGAATVASQFVDLCRNWERARTC